MDKKSKILLGVFIAIVVVLFIYKYNTLFIQHNFSIKALIGCDESIHSCFTHKCTFGEAECDTGTYAKLLKNLKNTSLCNQYSTDCPELSCGPDDSMCQITYCSTDNLEEGEVCIGPNLGESAIIQNMSDLK